MCISMDLDLDLDLDGCLLEGNKGRFGEREALR